MWRQTGDGRERKRKRKIDREVSAQEQEQQARTRREFTCTNNSCQHTSNLLSVPRPKNTLDALRRIADAASSERRRISAPALWNDPSILRCPDPHLAPLCLSEISWIPYELRVKALVDRGCRAALPASIRWALVRSYNREIERTNIRSCEKKAI